MRKGSPRDPEAPETAALEAPLRGSILSSLVSGKGVWGSAFVGSVLGKRCFGIENKGNDPKHRCVDHMSNRKGAKCDIGSSKWERQYLDAGIRKVGRFGVWTPTERVIFCFL